MYTYTTILYNKKNNARVRRGFARRYAHARACARVQETADPRKPYTHKRMYTIMDYVFRTAAKEKFLDYAASGQIRDFQPIPSGLFTKEELRELYMAGNLYLFIDRNGSYFKAVIF